MKNLGNLSKPCSKFRDIFRQKSEKTKQNKTKQKKQTETHTNKQMTLTWSPNYCHRVKEESWKLGSSNNISFLPTCVHTSQLDELQFVIDVTKCLVNSKPKFVPGLFPSLELSFSLSSCGIKLKGRFMTLIGHFRVHLSLHFKARLSAKSLL